jgi:ATP-dependent DNA ligase
MCLVPHQRFGREQRHPARHSVEGDGAKMFKAVCKLGLEGIVSKKLDSPYK